MTKPVAKPMRKLGLSDTFAVARILKKMDIQPANIPPGASQEQIFLTVTQQVVKHLGDAEKEIVEFLADLKGAKPKEIQSYDIDQTFDLIEEFKELNDVKTFFTRVSKLIQ